MDIQYTRSKVAGRPTFRTQKFGNLLSDTYQAEVHQSEDGTWSGWLMNLSRIGESQYRFGFGSRAAATRWTNKQLRERLG